jgi:hypothetical protein
MSFVIWRIARTKVANCMLIALRKFNTLSHKNPVVIASSPRKKFAFSTPFSPWKCHRIATEEIAVSNTASISIKFQKDRR